MCEPFREGEDPCSARDPPRSPSSKAIEAELALRSALEQALADPEVNNAFDVFGADLADEAFVGVFDRPRQHGWREVDL